MVEKIEELLIKVARRKSLTQSEIEDIRIDLSILRAMAVDRLLTPAANERIAAELHMEGIEGRELKKYFVGYSGQEYENSSGEKKKITASVADSLARKAMKAENTPYYHAYKKFLEAKQEESRVYQLLKSVDQVTNALSAITKYSNV